MIICEYDGNIKLPYHFESSDRYCDLEKINKAYSSVVSNERWNCLDKQQLDTILKLEKARYELAKGNIELEEYKKTVQNEVRLFFEKHEFNVFSNTEIHNKFYEYLNDLY